MSKGRRLVPSLLDLCTKYVGENLGSVVKCLRKCRADEEDKESQPLWLSPFEILRNNFKDVCILLQHLIMTIIVFSISIIG